MKLLDQRGALNGLLIPFILMILLFIGAASFGVWAFNSRQDYKKHSDAKVAAGQALTKQQVQQQDAATYAQEAKYPLRAYIGPSAFGSVTINYPKTWSAYVQTSSQATPINGFFEPDVVPDAGTFALRVQLLSGGYTQQIARFIQGTKDGKVTVAPYSLPKVSSVVGSIVQGQIEPGVQGEMVILPLRNMTLELWTEQPAEESDFTNIILANATFAP